MVETDKIQSAADVKNEVKETVEVGRRKSVGDHYIASDLRSIADELEADD